MQSRFVSLFYLSDCLYSFNDLLEQQGVRLDNVRLDPVRLESVGLELFS